LLGQSFLYRMSRTAARLRLLDERADEPRRSRRSETVKYILLMNTMRANAGGFGDDWQEGDIDRHISYMIAMNEGLRAAGELVGAEGLTFPDQAKLVVAGARGEPITDGVFPESKEFLAGFWTIDVATPERAYAIAAQASAAPGPGGAPLNMPIEVRPLAMKPRKP
jgi:hypothetical protein